MGFIPGERACSARRTQWCWCPLSISEQLPEGGNIGNSWQAFATPHRLGHGMIGTVEIEFWGEPAISLSLIAM